MFERSWGPGNGESLFYADELPGGEYLAIGNRFTPWGTEQYYVARLNSTGEVVRETEAENFNYPGHLAKVIKTRWGGYLLAGWEENGGLAVTTIDADGFAWWTREYHPLDGARPVALCETIDSCFAILYSSSSSPGLLKIDRSGNGIWVKNQNFWPGWEAKFIAQNPDGSFLMCGNMNAAARHNIFIAKFFTDGTISWVKAPCGLNDTLVNDALGLFPHPDGSLDVLFATDPGSPPYPDAYTELLSLDSAGNYLSTSLYQLPIRAVFYDGSYILANTNAGSPDIWSMLPDKSFQHVAQVEQRDAPLSRNLFYLAPSSDGGYLGAGNVSGSDSGYYMARFDSKGRTQAEDFSATVKAYPNPSTDGNICLEFDVIEAGPVDVEIYSANGQLVYRASLLCPASSHTRLPVHADENTFAAGLYIIRVKTSAAIFTEKLIVARPQPGH